MRLSIRHMILVAPALIGSYTLTGCSNQDASTPAPPVVADQPVEVGKKAPARGLEDFERRLAEKQAKDKAKAGNNK